MGIKHGLIGVWSCVEACSSFRAHYDAQAGFPQPRHLFSRCKHLYFYYDHPLFGFMSVRLQTWFPYGIQIAFNNRFMDQMAAVKDTQPFRQILDALSKPRLQNSRRIRSLEITGKDREFLQALSDPKFAVSGLTNKDLRQILRLTPWAKGGSEKQLSARISRHLRLMREHGLIRKMPNQRRYLLTSSGQILTTAHIFHPTSSLPGILFLLLITAFDISGAIKYSCRFWRPN
ncbi:MAG: winged helix-turn-helix domain-containing protein [Kiritimatiellae bacterium]|nr:winged helix-turn-helix domain-containing protein [Kiritimatiellia bacterium]